MLNDIQKEPDELQNIQFSPAALKQFLKSFDTATIEELKEKAGVVPVDHANFSLSKIDYFVKQFICLSFCQDPLVKFQILLQMRSL